MGKNRHPRGWGTPVLGRKHCSWCGRWRPLTDFRAKERDPATGEALRLDHLCDACSRAYRREHYRKNPEKLLARQREWHRLQRRLRGQQQRYPDGRGYMGHVVLEPYRGLSGRQEVLPEGPLRAWLEIVVKREVFGGNDMEALALLLGVGSGQLRSIRRAEYVSRSRGLAERMLSRYGQPVRVPGFGAVWRVEDLWPCELGESEAAVAA